ncbi:hypothetical protein FZC83_01900 [Rossellomorea marisflavi]|uniref:DNA primase n=1 Tax=Rossellomorea marisflavi TaxID=189381 RepID=A0A5D4S2F9_9BACI|nr:hypothetical protein [Rossellomorea marisflavi]TYS56348.1 hypothetical protein FZC83_01900 [Rossellomorea marisflavi]
MRLDKDKIKDSLTTKEIHRILKDLGSKDPLQGIQYQTVCHGGSSHKLYYYEESKTFHCYTSCSESMDIYELVSRSKDISFPQAVKYVAELTNKTFGFGSKLKGENGDIVSDWEWLNKFTKKEKKLITLPEYNDKVLQRFTPKLHESWFDEGISLETAEKFRVGYYFRENSEAITIPHYDLNNRLVGIRRRSLIIEDVDNGRKYMPITVGNTTYNHQTMFNVYGLHTNKGTIKRLKKIFFYEGEKSVFKTEDVYGGNNFSCAVCSSQITDYHRDIALSLGVEEVFIGFDKFRAKKEYESEEVYQKLIEKYQDKLLKFARKFTPYCKVFIIWDDFDLLDPKDSPIDKGKSILEQLMKCKYEIKTSGVEL